MTDQEEDKADIHSSRGPHLGHGSCVKGSCGIVHHGHCHTTPHLQPHADDAEQLTVESPQADLLRWHYCLGHLSFKLIKAMSEVGLLPKHLAKARIPKCAGCMFAAMTKKPWRTKGSKSGQVGRKTKITRPGQCVSVDQLESPQVGLISQIKG